MDAGNYLDIALVTSLAVGGAVYLLRDRLFGPPVPPSSGMGLSKVVKDIAGSTDALRTGTPVNGGAVGGGRKKKKSRDFIKVMRENNKNVIVFYGSQTGTADDYASRLAREFTSRFKNMRAMTADPENYDMFLLDRLPADHLAVFIVATYGEGEPTDNMNEFHRFLVGDEFSIEAYIPKEGEPPAFSKQEQGSEEPEDLAHPLADLKYVVFGLGNRTYEHFNAMARRIDARLAYLGATRIGERGEGDDDANLEEDFLAWKENLWEAVTASMPGVIEGDGLNEPQFTCTELVSDEVDPAKIYHGELGERRMTLFGAKLGHDQKNPFMAPVIKTRPLFRGGERQCVHAEVDLSGSGLRYAAGDHIAIWPTNTEQQVTGLARWCGLTNRLDQLMTVTNNDATAGKKHPFPCPTTYRTALRHYIDISCCPSRQFVASLAAFVTCAGKNPNAAEFLKLLGQDKAAYQIQVAEPHMTAADLLAIANAKDTDGTQDICIPFELFVEGLGRLQQRYYSISSSPKVASSDVHITAVVLRYPMRNGEQTFHGLATNFLHTILEHNAPGSSHIPVTADGRQYYLQLDTADAASSIPLVRVPIYIRGSNFKLPRDPRTPIIMVGPGTGVAPFRGFLQERAHIARNGSAVGTTMLFYGCRRANEDFLYAEEWEEMFGAIRSNLSAPANAQNMDAEELASELVCAFSREPGQPKVYVQDRLLERKQQLWRWLQLHRGYFYVCGDAKNMARAVNQTLVDIAAEVGGLDEEAAHKWVKNLRSASRYQEDVWS